MTGKLQMECEKKKKCHQALGVTCVTPKFPNRSVSRHKTHTTQNVV